MSVTDITVETLPPRPVAVMRSIRSVPQIGPWISAVFDEVAAVVASSEADPAGPPFARYHPQGENVVQIEAGYPCTEPIADKGFVEASTLPGGQVASTVYIGPYEGLGTAYHALRTWIESHDGRVVGDPLHVYLDRPADGADPTLQRTQIIQPFEPTDGADSTGRAPARAPIHRQLTKRVRDVMTPTVVTATPETPLPALVDLMVRSGFSGIPIVDEEAGLVGVVTEADLISKAAYGGTQRRPLAVLGDMLHGRDSKWSKKAKGLAAADVMTTTVETARPDDDIRVAARRMVEHGVKRLPVVDEGRVVGIVARPDVLRAMHQTDEELEREIATVFSDPLGAPDATLVEVTVRDGVVELTGTVQFPIDIPVLSAIVWRMPGVIGVHNEVTATEPNPQPQPTHGYPDYEYFRYFR